MKRYLYSMCKTCDLEDLYALKPRTEMDTEMPDGRCVQLATARLDESHLARDEAGGRSTTAGQQLCSPGSQGMPLYSIYACTEACVAD